MGKDIPLHKRTHFRRIREIIKEIGEFEGCNVYNYDLTRIKAYETIGESLKGKNVGHNIKKGRSCWVGDNQYDIFEVPSKNNKRNSTYGEFLYLALNKSFQYFIFGKLTVTLDVKRSIENKRVIEKVKYNNFGKYDITFERGSDGNYIHKSETGSDFDPGESSKNLNYEFDKFNTRKIAYKTDKYKILKSIGVETLDPTKIIGSKEVSIYKDKNKRKD